MPRKLIELGLIGRSAPPLSRWAERELRPFALLPAEGAPALDPGAVMHDAAGVQTIWLGVHGVSLHSGDASNYIDNLAAGTPRLWVAMSDGAVQMLTADPYEGEALATDPGRIVEALAMPPETAAELAEFARAHHVHEPFVKRRKDRQPDGDTPRAPRILPPDQNWIRK
ncbi:MAG: DUF3305 domain-containing protein [Paracoccus sp. (in: a-proteobacteria)]|nr:DUF3305 domain-containing protein [Paracoccus sp. (in: a-proteobacteria)]